MSAGALPLALSSTGAFGVNLAATLVAVLVLMLATLALAVRLGRHSVVDVIWGIGLTLIAVVTLVLSGGHGDAGTRVLVTVLTAVWGLRLAVHVGRRNAGKGEDPRYADLMAKAPGSPTLFAFRRVYLTQGAVMWFVSLPVQAAQYIGRGIGLVAILGALVWALGLFFEAVGDLQLQRFTADPENRGRVMDRGLWRYTRHPNYFGDACVWWGLFVIACSAPIGLATVLSPIAMTGFLLFGTGKALLEKDIGNRRAGYDEYVRRTSGFVPLPPRSP